MNYVDGHRNQYPQKLGRDIAFGVGYLKLERENREETEEIERLKEEQQKQLEEDEERARERETRQQTKQVTPQTFLPKNQTRPLVY